MNQAAVTGTLIRVSIIGDDRRMDVSIPGAVPLVEVMPSVVRGLGVLDPTLVHGGFRLSRASGEELDPSLSATAQSVHDGDVLTLTRGHHTAESRIYDDITEAVLDATSDMHRPWSATDNTRAALATSLTFLALSLVLLLRAGDGFAWTALVAGGGAIVLLVASAVLGWLGSRESGDAFAVAAAVYAAAAGYLAAPSGPLWGWPLAVSAGAALLAGIVAAASRPRQPEYALIGAVWGVVIGVPALVAAIWPGATISAYVVTVAVAGALGNLLPWLALSSTRIRIISAQTEQEVYADPVAVDGDAVKARAASGARVLIALRIGVGAAVITATPLVASLDAAGALLITLVFLGMMFQSRQAFARNAVFVIMTIGTVGLAVAGLTVLATQPALQPAMLVLLIAATAVVTSLTLLNPRARVKLARAADAIEVVVLVAIVPLGVFAAGWA